jgi:hypothetical protein
MTIEGLGDRGLLAQQDADSLTRLQNLAAAFQVMAEKELRGEPLTEDEYYFIRFYGGELEHLTMAAADSDEAGGLPVMDEEPQAAVIADVATAPDPDGDGVPNPVALEEAVGRIDEIYAVVPIVNDDGSVFLQVAKGGVFAYYEFQWPADDRLTDDAWRAMLDAGEAPPRPVWIDSFFSTETENAIAGQVTYSFARSLSYVFWELDTESWINSASPEAEAIIAAEVEALRQAGHYVGHQWLTADIRSVDRQADNRLVVAVREHWDDTLYTITGDFRDGSSPINHRGPYIRDVTYTLEKTDNGWWVTNVVYGNEPPEWGDLPAEG